MSVSIGENCLNKKPVWIYSSSPLKRGRNIYVQNLLFCVNHLQNELTLFIVLFCVELDNEKIIYTFKRLTDEVTLKKSLRKSGNIWELWTSWRCKSNQKWLQQTCAFFLGTVRAKFRKARCIQLQITAFFQIEKKHKVLKGSGLVKFISLCLLKKFDTCQATRWFSKFIVARYFNPISTKSVLSQKRTQRYAKIIGVSK